MLIICLNYIYHNKTEVKINAVNRIPIYYTLYISDKEYTLATSVNETYF